MMSCLSDECDMHTVLRGAVLLQMHKVILKREGEYQG